MMKRYLYGLRNLLVGRAAPGSLCGLSAFRLSDECATLTCDLENSILLHDHQSDRIGTLYSLTT